MRAMQINEIGGGRVTRPFKSEGSYVPVGTILAVEFLRRMPTANRNALIEKNYIHVWPKSAQVSPPALAAGRQPQRYKISLGFGRYDVVEGVKLNDKHLTKEEAEKLAKPKKARKPKAPTN